MSSASRSYWRKTPTQGRCTRWCCLYSTSIKSLFKQSWQLEENTHFQASPTVWVHGLCRVCSKVLRGPTFVLLVGVLQLKRSMRCKKSFKIGHFRIRTVPQLLRKVFKHQPPS